MVALAAWIEGHCHYRVILDGFTKSDGDPLKVIGLLT
jgi:hypothetical protein